MFNTTVHSFIEQCLTEGIDPDKIFFKVRNEFPDQLDELSKMCPPGKQLRSVITEVAKARKEQRDDLCSTPAGKRFYEVCIQRMQFKAELLTALETKVEALRATDPGTDIEDVTDHWTNIVDLQKTMESLDTNQPNEADLVRSIIDEVPELYATASELYPGKLPKR